MNNFFNEDFNCDPKKKNKKKRWSKVHNRIFIFFKNYYYYMRDKRFKLTKVGMDIFIWAQIHQNKNKTKN